MSSGDSSSEEDVERLKEAVDQNFLTDDLYSSQKGAKPNAELTLGKGKVKPSLRPTNKVESGRHHLHVRVTPEFQNFVSKKLIKILDKNVDDSRVILHNTTSHSSDVGGIYLLSSSKDYASVSENCTKISSSKNNQRKSEIEVEDWEEKLWERASEVAVSPKWVLSQEETKHWAPSTKGEFEMIKTDK